MPLDREQYNSSNPTSFPSISVDNGILVGDTVSTQNITGKILYSGTGTTYIPVGISTVVANSVAYQATAPSNPSVGQIWVDSSSNNTNYDPNLIRRKTIVATGGQTAFTADLAFTDGYEQVFLNGLLLTRNTDYTTVNSIQVNLVVAAVVNDVIDILSITNLNAIQATGALTTSNTFTGAQIFSASNAAITPITVNGAFNQTGDLLDINNYSGTRLLTIDSSGYLAFRSSVSSVYDNNIDGSVSAYWSAQFSSVNGSAKALLGSSSPQTSFVGFSGQNLASKQIISSYLYGTLSDTTSGAEKGVLVFLTKPSGTNATERMRITDTGSVGIGTNSPFGRLDINTDAGVTSSIAIQSGAQSRFWISAAATPNNYFTIGGNGVSAPSYGSIIMDTGGRVAMGTTLETTKTPVSGATLQVNVQNGGESAAWFKNFGGTTTSPTETTDWPQPVLGLTAYGNFYLQTMLNFGLPGDGLYHTDDSIWNFKLNGVTSTGWDVNSTTPINTSAGTGAGPVGLQLLGPGNLRIGSVNAYNIYFRTNGQDNVMINSSGYLMAGYSTSQGTYRLQVNGTAFLQGGYTTSDIKYKEKIKPLTNGLNLINALKPVEFSWKDQNHITDENGKILREKHEFIEGRDLGFIAQDVEKAFKDKEWLSTIVKENKREAVKDNEGNILIEEENFLGISHNHIIAILVSAVQELTERLKKVEDNK